MKGRRRSEEKFDEEGKRKKKTEHARQQSKERTEKMDVNRGDTK